MHAEIYTDGVDEITVGGSIIRVDLVSLSPTERDANNAPKKVFCQRLILPVEAFANSVEVMQNALQGLIDAGAIRRTRSGLTADPSHVVSSLERDPPAANTPRPPNVSTNFR